MLLFYIIFFAIASGIIAILSELNGESKSAWIFGVITLVLAIGLFISSEETNLVSQTEFQLAELSDVTINEYDKPSYLISSTSSDNKTKLYSFWYYDKNGFSKPCSIDMSEAYFNFEANGHSVLIQSYESVTKYYRILPIDSTYQNMFTFIIPKNGIVEIYNSSK